MSGARVHSGSMRNISAATRLGEPEEARRWASTRRGGVGPLGLRQHIRDRSGLNDHTADSFSKRVSVYFLIDRPLFLNKDDIYGPGNRRIKLHGLEISWIDGGGEKKVI